jgi:hypothetical protein
MNESVAPAEGPRFVPERVFVSDLPEKFCMLGDDYGWDRIWEIDPQTGAVRLFAELRDEDCGLVTGLAFTPDGCRLRAASALNHRVLEFAADGTWSVAFGLGDGAIAPFGANCLAYDAEGNFFLASDAGGIIRFPADGGTATLFADRDDGVQGGGPMAFAAGGDVYFGTSALTQDWVVIQITPAGTASPFANYGRTAVPHTHSLRIREGTFLWVWSRTTHNRRESIATVKASLVQQHS